MIYFYKHPLQSVFSDFLEQCISFFVSQKALFDDDDQQIAKILEMSLPEDISERNLMLWQTMQEKYLEMRAELKEVEVSSE